LLGVVTEQVRMDLALSDTQMSLANGLFFTLFNLVGGLFLSRMIDRGNRKRILSARLRIGPSPVSKVSPAARQAQTGPGAPAPPDATVAKLHHRLTQSCRWRPFP
jgi:hypothetical protein